MRGCCSAPGFAAAWFPLMIRIVLGAVFLAHGSAKVIDTFEPTEKQRAELEEMGVLEAEGDSGANGGESGVLGLPKRGEGPLGVYKLALLLRAKGQPATSEKPAEGSDSEQTESGNDSAAKGAEKAGGVLQNFLYNYAPALAWLTAATELIGGGLLVIGLLSRVWALGLTIAMGVALALVHWHVPGPEWYAGFNVFHPKWVVGEHGPERALILAILSFSILVAGPGVVSLDHLLFGPQRQSTESKRRPQEPE